jgi:hypothetical protein
MTASLYLTEITKEFYLDDFKSLIAFKENDYWKLDDGLDSVLQKINGATDFQTLFSKKYKFTDGYFASEPKSYLDIAFTQKVKRRLHSLLLSFQEEIENQEAKLSFQLCEPADNVLFSDNPPYNIGCFNNSDYCRIKHFHIELESSNENMHNHFFEMLGNLLERLSEQSSA